MFSKKKFIQQSAVLSLDELLSKLENFCAYRERCPKEVQAKLEALGAAPSDAQQIFDALQTDNFFDEQRFAFAYARGKFRNNNWGKVRIRLELRMRDISPALIEAALDAIEMEDYNALAVKLLERKMAQYAGDTKARDKSAASLIRAGFESGLIFKLLDKIK